MHIKKRQQRAQLVYLDLTHLGRHVTGIERIAIELFEKVPFERTEVRPIRASGTIAMVFMQQIWLPLLALFNPSAAFVFPGFPPSPWFVLCRNRVIWYVHDLFLMTRPADLSTKAKLYMAGPFRFSVSRLKYFFVNSKKTAAELKPFVAPDSAVALYRPKVENVFKLELGARDTLPAKPKPLKLVSLGTVEPRKNYAHAVAICDALANRGFPDVELHIIGRSGWGDASAVIAQSPRVIVHGYLGAAEVKRIFETADIYLCTSFDEGLGLPLLEAQYAGLPVFAPEAPVFREALGRSGHFIGNKNADDDAERIIDLLASPNWRKTSSQTAVANPKRWNTLANGDAAHAHKAFATPLASNTFVHPKPNEA